MVVSKADMYVPLQGYYHHACRDDVCCLLQGQHSGMVANILERLGREQQASWSAAALQRQACSIPASACIT